MERKIIEEEEEKEKKEKHGDRQRGRAVRKDCPSVFFVIQLRRKMSIQAVKAGPEKAEYGRGGEHGKDSRNRSSGF